MAKILAVDDDRLIRSMVSRLLTKQGHDVTTAENGIEGLEIIKRDVPDLVISDVLMPEMDGYQFCEAIREVPQAKHVPILLLTSLDSINEKIKGFESGAEEYIVKPFMPEEFFVRINGLLARSKRSQQAPPKEQTTGKVVSVFSLRGGAGVSSIAVNLSVGFAQVWEKETTLVDMVLMGGQSALFLNQSLRTTWENLANAPLEDIDREFLHKTLLPHASGVQTLASPKRPEFSELITPGKVQQVISLFRNTSEYIVLDLPHDFHDQTLIALDMSDVVLLVVQPEIASVRAATMTLDIFRTLEYDIEAKVKPVINWTFPSQGIARSAIEKSLKLNTFKVLPNASEEMLRGMNYGNPLTYANTKHPLAMLFEDMALELGQPKHQKKTPEEPSNAWKRAVKRYRKRRSANK